ncbi:hypothetical protein Prudu_189S000700 [Prunus dulcis]|uniref:Uncharacterized protein n=1 Tax=Prunus dulcis TaxID=3755 RepID=A0A5H2Y3J3_PRUDU|nr:hypothetical protein Prudu_189S000700 [Prunus dulcis]
MLIRQIANRSPGYSEIANPGARRIPDRPSEIVDLKGFRIGIRSRTEQQEGPSRGPASSDQHYMFLNHCGYPVQKQVAVKKTMSTDIHVAFGLCCLQFMLPSDMMMSTDIQFTFSYVSALDICLMSFGDARTMSARIADQADYGLLNPASSRRAQESTTRPSPSSHATYKMGDSAEISAGVQRKF